MEFQNKESLVAKPIMSLKARTYNFLMTQNDLTRLLEELRIAKHNYYDGGHSFEECNASLIEGLITAEARFEQAFMAMYKGMFRP